VGGIVPCNLFDEPEFLQMDGRLSLKLLGYVEYSGFLVLGYYLAKTTTNSNKTRLIAGLALLPALRYVQRLPG